jgi:hypothetical protein
MRIALSTIKSHSKTAELSGKMRPAIKRSDEGWLWMIRSRDLSPQSRSKASHDTVPSDTNLSKHSTHSDLSPPVSVRMVLFICPTPFPKQRVRKLRRHTPGAEAPFRLNPEKPKAEALGYLEARNGPREIGEVRAGQDCVDHFTCVAPGTGAAVRLGRSGRGSLPWSRR